VAADVAESYRDGVWLAEFAPIADPALEGYQMAETEKILVGSYVYSRTMLLFRVRDESLQSWLAPPWRVSHFSSGPWTRVNLVVGFCDVVSIWDSSEKPASPISNRYVPLNGPIQSPEADQATNAWYRAYAIHPDALLGWRGFAAHPGVRAEFSVAQTRRGLGSELVVTEHQEVRTGHGSIELDIEYEPGPLQPYAWNRQIVFAVNPSSALFYKNQEFRDYITGNGLSSARLRHLHYRIAVPELEMFDGTEELISVTAVP
jgi:hypothetical protein